MSFRESLIETLRSYAGGCPAERAVADRIRGLIEARGDCLLRSCRPGHLTGSAWVVSSDGSRHLLLHHRKLGRWLQPGGHADGEADLAAVARREAQEETGLAALRIVAGPSGLALLDIDVHDIPARHSFDGTLIEDAHEHHDLRFLFRAEEDRLIGNDESHEVRWFSEDEVRAITQEDSVLRLLEKARRRLASG